MTDDLKPRVASRYLVAAVLVGLVWLILPRVLIGSAGFENMDEAYTAVIARILADGGVPYRDAVDHRGFVTPYAYAAGMFVFEALGLPVHAAIRMTLYFALSILLVGIVAFARSTFGSRVAAATALTFAALSYVGVRWDFMALHTEWFMITFELAGVALIVRWMKGGTERLLWASGALFALAFLTKQPSAVDAAWWTVVIFAGAALRGGEGVRELIRPVAGFLAGVAAPVLLAVAVFASLGALGDAFYWFWRYNREIYVAAIPWTEHVLVAAKVQPHFWLSLTPGALLGLAALRRARMEGQTRELLRENLPLIGVIGWMVTSYLGASLSGRDFGHYQQQIAVPWALLLAYSAARLPSTAPDRRHGLLAACVAAAFAISIGRNAVNPGDVGDPPFPGEVRFWLSHEEGGAIAEAIARDIAVYSRPEDAIFVWGWFPELYLETGLRPASRYVFCTFLAGLVPWTNLKKSADEIRDQVVPHAWSDVAEDFERTPPVAIVDTSLDFHRAFHPGIGPQHYEYLRDYMRGYVHVATYLAANDMPWAELWVRADRVPASGEWPETRAFEAAK